MDTKPKLLLIWQEIPDNTKVYVFKTDTHAAQLARQCAGIYINGSWLKANHPIHELYELLEHNTALNPDEIITGNFSEVVICGFIL